MPDKKITDLVDGAPLQPTDEFVVARAGDNFKIDGAEVVAAVTKHDVTLGGNTAGALALISSGTMSLAGGNNITLSQAGNAVTISGAAAGGAQTAISGLANSQTTYTSGTVSLSELGALTIRSSTGQIFQIEAPATSSLSATGAVSIVANGSTVSIGAPVQSVQPETQTFIAGISASDTLYTSGNVRLTGVGGGVTVSSNTGQRVDISVAAPVAQSVQTQNMVAVTLSGNTSGAQALISSGTLTLAGGNNITVSQAGNAVTISGPNVAGAQTGISGIANSETTYTSGTVSLSELGAITIRSTTGNQFQLSVNAQSVQPETQTFIAGVSASDTLYTSGNVRITGVGGGITVSSNTGQRIDLSVAAQSVQPETQTFIAGISASNTLYTSGNVRISGSQAVTVRSGTGQLVVIDAPAQSVQPETQTFIAGVSVSDTLYTSGNVRITGVGGGITVSSNTGQRIDLSVASPVAQTNQAGSVYAISNTSGTSSGTYDARTLSIAGAGMITVAASNSGWRINATQSVQPETQTFIGGISASDTLYTSGSVRFTGVGGGVTVSSNTGQRVDISVAAPVAATNLSIGVSTGGNTLGDTGVATGSRFVIVGSNGITASQGTGAGATTVTLSGVTQSVQTQGGFVSLGVSTGGNTVGNTQVSTGSRFVLVASGNATASQATAAGASTVTISVGTQTVQTQQNIQALYDGANSISTGTVRVTDANGVTFSINAQTLSASVNQSISMFAVSNTTQSTSGTAHKSALSFGGAGIASVGVTGGSVVISVPAGGGAGDGGVFGGVSTMGNTAGSTGTVSTGNFVLVGTGPISLSQSTGAAGSAATVTIDAPATSSLSATGAVEISTNGSTISIGAPNIKTLGDFQNFPLNMAALMTHAASISKTPFYFPVEIPGRITNNSFVIRLSAVTTATLQSFTIHGGFYTMVNSTSMALLGSWSETYVASTASSVSWSGVRNYVMTGQGTHAALSVLTGGDYAVGMMFSAGAAGSMAQSIMGAGSANPTLGRIVPGVNAQSTGTSQGAIPLMGRGSTTVNVLPANVVASELVNQGSGASAQLQPWIYIRS